jgi:hypothetical protein
MKEKNISEKKDMSKKSDIITPDNGIVIGGQFMNPHDSSPTQRKEILRKIDTIFKHKS